MTLKSSEIPQNETSLKATVMSSHFIKGQIFNKDVRDQFVKRAKCYLENQQASSLQKLMQSTDITGLIELSKPLLSKPFKKNFTIKASKLEQNLRQCYDLSGE